MITFRVSPFDAVWEIARNERLVCYVDQQPRAVELAEWFADNCNRRGKEAVVILSNRPMKRRLGQQPVMKKPNTVAGLFEAVQHR